MCGNDASNPEICFCNLHEMFSVCVRVHVCVCV